MVAGVVRREAGAEEESVSDFIRGIAVAAAGVFSAAYIDSEPISIFVVFVCAFGGGLLAARSVRRWIG